MFRFYVHIRYKTEPEGNIQWTAFYIDDKDRLSAIVQGLQRVAGRGIRNIIKVLIDREPLPLTPESTPPEDQCVITQGARRVVKPRKAKKLPWFFRYKVGFNESTGQHIFDIPLEPDRSPFDAR